MLASVAIVKWNTAMAAFRYSLRILDYVPLNARNAREIISSLLFIKY